MSFRKSTRITYKGANADGSHSYVLDYDLPDGNHRSLIAMVSRRGVNHEGDRHSTELDENVPARDMLVQAIEDFDRAGHCLMTNVPEAMRPVHLQYMAKNSDGEHRYLVLVSLSNGQQKKYVFRVSEQAGNDVACPDEFLTDIAGSADLAEPLTDAIRNLYIACTAVT